MEAIYARQSIDKKDSISIETQIEACMKKVSGKEVKIFSDKGFSGKSTDRPEFQNMMMEIRKGSISKIIIYKLDRISRSLIDFLNMRLEFSKYNVELISCIEDFDTSTPSGKLMLNILMMFAEMERESIQKRIKDNYYARGEKGFYLGGYAPFGYNKVKTQLFGKKTYTFEENLKESQILRKMYLDYANGKSLSKIARELTENKVSTKRGNTWHNSTISRMLKNPVYVKANAEVYNYLKNKGAIMNNLISDFQGENGCLVYGDTEKRTGAKFANFNNYYITIGLHKGIIQPSLWLEVQYKLDSKKNHSNLGTGSLTWLQGLIKCSCSYTYYVKKTKSNNRFYRYLYCRGRRNGSCVYSQKMIQVDMIEEIVEKELLEYLNNLKDIQTSKIVKDNPKINALKIHIANIDEKINSLIDKLSNSSEITALYLNKKIEKLHYEKKEYIDKIGKLKLKDNNLNKTDIDINYILKRWRELSIEDKKVVAQNIIKNIIIENKDINIYFLI